MSGISYRQDFSLWWPDYDHKPDVCHMLVKRDVEKLSLPIRMCKGHRLAVQAGGHAGIYPMKLAEHFKQVVTFEPDPILFECLTRNVQHVGNIQYHRIALGDHFGSVMMKVGASAGSMRVSDEGSVQADLMPIDGFRLPQCDAIFLDVEGYEVQALQGAEQTIMKYRPLLCIEELPRSRDAIHGWMASHGYRFEGRAGKDMIYV